MKGWLIVTLVSLLALMVPGPARTQEPELILLEEIQVTATREPRTSFDVPTGVTIVGPKEIERRTPEVLPDLLRGAEGVFVQQTTAGQATPIIRGLKGD